MEVIPPKNNPDEKYETKALVLDDYSPEIIQAIYHKVTEKTDKIQNVYLDNVETDLEGVRELTRFIDQTLKTFDIKPPSVRVRVSHDGGENLQYESLEKFSLYQTSNTKPILNLNIKYSFLLATPTQKSLDEIENKFSPYEVEVSILPTVIDEKTAAPDVVPGVRKFLMASKPSVVSEITYVDYAVARAFQSAINEWFDTVKADLEKKYVTHLKKHSPNYFKALRIVGTLCALIFIFKTLPNYSSETGNNFESFSKWIMLSTAILLFISATVKICEQLHDMFIVPLDRYCVLKINAGDKNNARRVLKLYKVGPQKILKAILGTIIAIILNVIAALLVRHFFNI